MSAYATVDDVITLWRPLTPEEETRTESLLSVVSDLLRQAAQNAGKDLDEMIEAGKLLPSVAKAVTVDVTARILRQTTTGDAMSQETQTALGYTWSGTYAVPGGGMSNAIMRSDLKRLGIYKQQIGVIELYGKRDSGCDDTAP